MYKAVYRSHFADIQNAIGKIMRTSFAELPKVKIGRISPVVLGVHS